MKRCLEILDRAKNMLNAKDHDYSGTEESLSNFESSLRIGVEPYKGAFIRLQDKYNRCCNLINGSKTLVKDEKLEDTLLDMICYGSIVLSLYLRHTQIDGGKLVAGSIKPENNTGIFAPNLNGDHIIHGVHTANFVNED